MSILDDVATRPPSGDAPAPNPYGDGWASERIARLVEGRLGLAPLPPPSGFDTVWPTHAADVHEGNTTGIRPPHFRLPSAT